MPAQPSFEDLGPALQDVEFVVVDLETTGTSADSDAITEIGAVRVLGGEITGEFQTFVDPQRPIPAYIARLTGINDRMVAGAPTISAVLPMFLEFARGTVLVAHNAKFDIGFLRTAAARTDYAWPKHTVVDTLTLARRTFPRGEVQNHRLGTLAAHVGATVVPNHRALSDARATVDVLHEIIARLGGIGGTHLYDLTRSGKQATPAQLRKRHLADGIPPGPGVYTFIGADGAVLYVGKSMNLRSRVRSYFSPSETRRKVLDIIPLTERVDVIECASDTEASIRELRMIAEQRPPANRQGLRPSAGHWLRLGAGAAGLRAARTTKPEDDGTVQIGPLRSHHHVEPMRSLLYRSILGPDAQFGPTRGDDSFHQRMRRAMTTDPSEVLDDVAHRLRALTTSGRFEDAAQLRERTEAFLEAAARAQRLREIAEVPFIVATRRHRVSESSPWIWETLAIRHGRLGAVLALPSHGDPVASVEHLRRISADEADKHAPLCFGYWGEAELILHWLQQDGVRIVHVDGDWSSPATGAFDLGALSRAFARTAAATD
ncbi:DEDD exonuclease domain-containing protein [Helcobacillus massiliensis]|uniref:DEDD exonuclease domain-containing protein n=1 Tax=Helcobacillus massiliensis TaxID=521392 RepID=UPI0021A863AA|nr:DEDD exonuclease domain-containing protein [Helcobacillus massiliensis]